MVKSIFNQIFDGIFYLNSFGTKLSLLRIYSTVVFRRKFSIFTFIKCFRPAERLQNKLVDVIDGACGEIRVQTAADKAAIFDCNHLLITLEYDQRVKEISELWAAAEAALRQCEKYLIKHRITEVEIAFPKVQDQNSTRIVYTNETGAIVSFV